MCACNPSLRTPYCSFCSAEWRKRAEPKQKHSPHCNLNFMATMDTENDYCDCLLAATKSTSHAPENTSTKP